MLPRILLIRPKRIYNLCLLHAHLGDIAMCFATLSYLFKHIWTNLLTQCIQCQFMSAGVCELQLLPIFTELKKFQEKYNKNQRNRSFRKTDGEPEGGHPL